MHNNIMAGLVKDRPPCLDQEDIPQGDHVFTPLKATRSESLNVTDVKTNLLWDVGRFTSRDGESLDSYYSRDNDPEQLEGKEMQKKFGTPCKYFAKALQNLPQNLRKLLQTSRNKTEIHQVGSQVVQQTGIQCFNYKGYGHYAKECRKPKRVKDYAYHKEKMMMCKQAEQGVPLQAEQADWLEDMDEEIDEQELETHYSYMAKIQEVSPEESSSTGQPLEQVQNHDESNVYDNVRRHSEQPESINDTYVLKKDDSNVTPDSSNICTNDNQVDQNAAECVDERAALCY
ncbi:retrovirus-related pol polyprotein from transposon TNT 1-94 [Tanacetum coccineum]